MAVAAAVLGAMEARRLVTLVHWERTMPFARDFLPGAIATTVMTLAAYLLLLILLFLPRSRKWALALGIAWGAIMAGTSLWVWVGPHAKNLWYEAAFHLHLVKTLVRYEVVVGPTIRAAQWLSGFAVLLAISSAKAFADSPRERLDKGIVLASLFYAAFYFLAMAVVARFVTPH